MYIIGLLLGLISLLGVLIDSKPLEIEASQKFDAAIALINHDIMHGLQTIRRKSSTIFQ